MPLRRSGRLHIRPLRSRRERRREPERPAERRRSLSLRPSAQLAVGRTPTGKLVNVLVNLLVNGRSPAAANEGERTRSVVGCAPPSKVLAPCAEQVPRDAQKRGDRVRSWTCGCGPRSVDATRGRD